MNKPKPRFQDGDETIAGRNHFCVDCKHFIPAWEEKVGGGTGAAELCGRYKNLVLGIHNYAAKARYDEKQCGRRGRGWEPIVTRSE